MAHFNKGPNYQDPFGADIYLRSTQDVKLESYMADSASMPTETVDGQEKKRLRKGTLMAVLTSGANAGNVVPFQAGAADGREDAANIVGICNTFLPWQLDEHDEPIAVAYEASVVKAQVFEYDAGGARIPIQAATIAALPTEKLKLLFH